MRTCLPLPDNLPAAERPSVLYRPWLFLDGHRFCALYGEDPTSGCAGYGDTPAEAMADFDRNWYLPARGTSNRDGS